jgi:uroporphyrinogen III methyltransferase/synthase
VAGGGKVFLVGAGPGDPELITLRGAAVLARADVVVYDGLANALLLDHAPPEAERIYAGKKHSVRGTPLTQEEIEDLLVERAAQGKLVVRLKGGDPFVFGRGGEEAERLVAAGIPFEVVPGVSSFSAVPAYAGIPLTHRDVASTVVALATGHEEAGRARVDWATAARADTLILFMAVKPLADIAARLVAAGRDPATPAAVIRWGTTAAQRTVVAPLSGIAAAVDAAGLKPPALVIIGEVVRYRERLAWFERRPLFGASVLVPRQREQARGFARLLAGLGAEPVIAEVTRIEPVDAAALAAALLAAPRPRWIAFTSANAVTVTLDALEAAGRDARALAGVRLAAVGAATAAALRARGLVADLTPRERTGAGLGAALRAADPELAGARVILPRAEEGRDELAEALAAAGADVVTLAAYRTSAAPAADLAWLGERLAAGDIQVLTFFAPSQVAAALALAPPAALNRARLIAAVGPTTADALRERGVRVDVVAAAPSAEALAADIAHHYLSQEAP